MTAEARVKELEARCESYQGLQFNYEMAKAELTAAQQDAQRLRDSAGEYARGAASTNSIESVWALL